jgi:hypothetical protein
MAPDVSREAHSRDDEGWQHVTSKTRRGRRNVQPVIEQPGEPKPHMEGLRTVAELEVEYRRTREQWEASAACAQLRELVASSASKLSAISKGICLGIGTFDPPDGGWETKRKTFVQIAAFLTTIDELGESRRKISQAPQLKLIMQPHRNSLGGKNPVLLPGPHLH